MPGTRTSWGLSVPERARRFTCAITVPPVLRAASAWSRAPRKAPSCSKVRLPRSSAVVARMIATSGAIAGKNSQSSPAKRSRRTMGSAAAAGFMAQPSCAGSTKVSSPTLVSTPGRFAAASRCMSNRMPEGTL